MATKWKNKLALLAWVLLFTLGLSGITVGLVHGSKYTSDYFQTSQFEVKLTQFIEYLSVFELNQMTKDEAKKAIMVRADEIKEHRYRYGDLPQQISNIKAQYEQRIQDALASNNKEIANLYMAERDGKIADITNNFKNDEYIRIKIVKEKEQKIDDYYQGLENLRAEYENYKATFKYYLKDTTTGAVYTNLNITNDSNVDEILNSKDMIFVRTYPSAMYGYLTANGRPGYIPNDFDGLPTTQRVGQFAGKIAVSKTTPSVSMVMADYHIYNKNRKVFLIYTISGIVAFLLSLMLFKIASIRKALNTEKLQDLYNRIPLDVGLLGLAVTGIITLISVTTYPPMYIYGQYVFPIIVDLLFQLFFAAIFVGLTLIQGRFLLERVKDWANLEAHWQKSLVYRACQRVHEAFLIRSIGTQILILLTVVFAWGAGTLLTLVQPRYIILYVPAVVVIGIPAIVLVVKGTGYFNRIVKHVDELVSGHYESDLPAAGKSVLAKLAENINTLKRGVKSSQKEQVKSERLKTELITNVSHDLRTPLTSIITYTELLKTPDLADEDREAYIQIIDRKSKRLKVLIEDLFEVSKMASGNMELVKEKVDLVQLLQQALAEHNETISKSTLQLRITNPDQPVYAIVDGQKLWRVFDNLIGNILKYALENTRVHISVKALRGQAMIVFKNVTKYELAEDVEELFERFKRGDMSRHTEGSGLGLAIAKSIIDLQGGSLDIEVDGDLFKVTISLNTSVD